MWLDIFICRDYRLGITVNGMNQIISSALGQHAP